MALPACCCQRRPSAPGPAPAPAPQPLVLSVPPAVTADEDTLTRVVMRNVSFRVDQTIRLRIHRLRGTMHDLTGRHVVVLDDKRTLLLRIDSGEIGLTANDLSDLLNRYVFGYPGSPLRDLSIRLADGHVVQRGILHKVVDIPFEMTGELSVTPEGLIRIHPIEMKICTIPGKGLMRALGVELADLIDLSGARGASIEGNDLFLDPVEILPPPRIAGRLTAIRVEPEELVQEFGSADDRDTAPLVLPAPADNFIYFRGGSIRFGKLYMVESELEAVDATPADPFDFYLDRYHAQLVAGYHWTLPDYGLVAQMPDYEDLGVATSEARTPRSEPGRSPASPASDLSAMPLGHHPPLPFRSVSRRAADQTGRLQR
jgi:hypothetical protein